jgi:glucose-6-phosphate isomerase
VWGEPGNNAQHSFFQLLHQGTARFSADFLAPVNGSSPLQRQHDLALANCFAQAEAFALGQPESQVLADLKSAGMSPADAARLAPHKVHAGNRPSSLILFPRLEPRTLGRLLAWYEHKVYVQSVIWDVNPFDQWGVELGKKLAETLVPAVETGDVAAQPSRLAALLEYVRNRRARVEA